MRDGSALVKQPFAIGHAAANPCRQLACLGCHPRSRFALAREAPRTSVIIMTPVSPANSRPTAATVASAAPATWMNDHTPPPSPTSGKLAPADQFELLPARRE